MVLFPQTWKGTLLYLMQDSRTLANADQKKHGTLDRSPKVKPKHIARPLVVGCSICRKPLLLRYFRLALEQTKNTKFNWVLSF